jgi:hypothetical protein
LRNVCRLLPPLEAVFNALYAVALAEFSLPNKDVEGATGATGTGEFDSVSRTALSSFAQFVRNTCASPGYLAFMFESVERRLASNWGSYFSTNGANCPLTVFSKKDAILYFTL